MEETKRVEDMSYFELLSWLGIGSSHPGGFITTKQTLSKIKVKPQDYVLEAGCGSGLTACYIAKTTQAKVMGIDISPTMIQKARLRVQKEGVSHLVEFREADVYALPFKNDSFDWVISESVAIFLDKAKVFQEYYRVLKPGGQVADLEMACKKSLPLYLRKQLHAYYGQETDPMSFGDWSNALVKAGFLDVDVKNPQVLNTDSPIISEIQKDWLLFESLAQKIKLYPGLIRRLETIAIFMNQNQHYFEYGLLYGRKPELGSGQLTFKQRINTWYNRIIK